MLKISLALCIVILTVSCGSPEAETTSPENKTVTETPVETRYLLQEYETYVASLDTTTEKSVGEAAEKYAKLFSKADRKVCDSAFVIFHDLYEKIENQLDYQVYTSPVYAELPCALIDDNGKELPMDKRLSALENRIQKNGFKLECREGYPGVAGDRSYITSRFYSFVSPEMREFLEGLRKEKEQHFAVDAGIAITEKEFADRLVWWENFNDKHPDFILAKRAKFIQKYLFTFFIIGMDNTPSTNYPIDENGVEKIELDTYFVKAYAYLNTKYPSSQSNALVKSFAAAVRKNDKVKSEQLIKWYTKRGLMIDLMEDLDYRY
ncbi:hypothetical protein D3C86_931710 [compost metagenome]